MASVDTTITQTDVTKAGIREKIWNHLEATNIAQFPRPVHHRIPNFKGAAAACDRAVTLDAFRRAQTVKVNPDKPQEQARFHTLEGYKNLLVPTPRLQRGLFNRIVPPAGGGKDILRKCSTSQGVKQYSVPVGLDARVKIDVIIIGSVAVSPKGLRIGKGEGYADMEYAMMATMGAVDANTVIITTVHDCQVLDDIPEHLFGSHDLTVDYIVTPTRTIKCPQNPKPTGIIWSLLTPEKLSEIPILQRLRETERKAGKDVRLKDEVEKSPLMVQSKRQPISEPVAPRTQGRIDMTETSPTAPPSSRAEKCMTSTERPPGDHLKKPEAKLCQKEATKVDIISHSSSIQTETMHPQKSQRGNTKRLASYSVYAGNIPHSCTSAMLISLLKAKAVVPEKVTWMGHKSHAFLHFSEKRQSEEAIEKISGLEIEGRLIKCEASRSKGK